MASFKCSLNSPHCHEISISIPWLISSQLSFPPTLGHLSETAVKFPANCWVDKDPSRCLSRQLPVPCINPLPFTGLRPLGYLSYLIAREHISGVLGKVLKNSCDSEAPTMGWGLFWGWLCSREV